MHHVEAASQRAYASSTAFFAAAWRWVTRSLLVGLINDYRTWRGPTAKPKP